MSVCGGRLGRIHQVDGVVRNKINQRLQLRYVCGLRATPASSCDGVVVAAAAAAVVVGLAAESEPAWLLCVLETRKPGQAFLSPEKKLPPLPPLGASAGEDGAGGDGLARGCCWRRASRARERLSVRRLVWFVWSNRPKMNSAGRGLPGRLIRSLLRELLGRVTWTTPVVPSAAAAPSGGGGRGLGV
jgi:hypothetical protein